MSDLEQIERWKVVYGHLFDEGEDGLPVPGQVVKHFRELRMWKAEELAHVLCLKSKRTVERMENESLYLDAITRRRALVVALGIPPFLLGLTYFMGIPPIQEIGTNTARTDSESNALLPTLTIESLWADLENYRHLHDKDNVQEKLAEIELMIGYQRKFIQSVSSNERKSRLYLLCGYYLLVVDIARQERNYEMAFLYANKAVNLANRLQDTELIAVTLMERACAYYDRGESGDLFQAKKDFDAAFPYAERCRASLKGLIYLESSVTYAYVAQDELDKRRATRLVDQAGQLMELDAEYPEGSIYRLLPTRKLWYQNLRGLVLIGVKEPKKAIEALDLAYDKIEPGNTRRLAFNHVYRARAEILQGHFAYATTLADIAFDVFDLVKSQHGMLRVKQLADELSKSSYGASKEVAQLRVKLIDKRTRRKIEPNVEEE